jgi:hypothetical protein
VFAQAISDSVSKTTVEQQKRFSTSSEWPARNARQFGAQKAGTVSPNGARNF